MISLVMCDKIVWNWRFKPAADEHIVERKAIPTFADTDAQHPDPRRVRDRERHPSGVAYFDNSAVADNTIAYQSSVEFECR